MTELFILSLSSTVTSTNSLTLINDSISNDKDRLMSKVPSVYWVYAVYRYCTVGYGLSVHRS